MGRRRIILGVDEIVKDFPALERRDEKGDEIGEDIRGPHWGHGLTLLFLLVFFIVVISTLTTVPQASALVSNQASGEQKILVIMAKFPDVQPTASIEQMKDKYFRRLDLYVRAVSGDRAWIAGKMTKWYDLSKSVKRYNLSPHNLSVDRNRVAGLIQEAVDLADKDEDISQYSLIFLSLGATRNDFGMAGLCGYPGMLGWTSQSPLKTKKGKKVPGGVAIYTEDAHVGVVFHDLAHILGGVQNGQRVVPCLYDHDLQGQPGPFRNYAQFYMINVGYFDPMSCHMVVRDQSAPGISAWTRLRLGWLEPDKIVEVARGQSKTVLLDPLTGKQPRIMALRIPLEANKYYLVENRQPIGVDQVLPSHGVLIYLADDRVLECRQGKSPLKLMNANPEVAELKGAPYTPQGQNTFKDEKRQVTIKVLSQKGEAVEVSVVHGK